MKYLFVFILFVISGCSSYSTDPQQIIDKAIENAGGEKFLKSTIEFDFRNRHYITRRKDGVYSHERIFGDSANTTHDFLTNEGFRREVNDIQVAVPDTMAVKYSNSVNSTIYFALLPFGLNDPAVRKKFIGKSTLDGESYIVVEVTFAQEDGGNDFTDEFLYWIHDKKFTVDYLAYRYYSEGGGLRFRKAFNSRIVNGILFQDYVNYKPGNDSTTLYEIESLYKQDALEELSRIELTNISVQ
jgi:hypothetical protein